MKLEEAVKRMKKDKVKRVLLQFPDGIKRRIAEIVKNFEKNGIEVAICLESTYGACDVREDEAKRLDCQAIVHLGHSDYGVKTEMSIYYVDCFLDVDPIPIIEKEFPKIEKFKNIGLVTSVQFVPAFKKVKEFLEAHGKKVFTYKSQEYEGQVLGCRVGAGKSIEDKVDAFLCVSAGKFYGLGLVLETEKPMFNLDLERQEIHDMDEQKKKIQKLEAWNFSALKDAKRVGLLVSWKKGQMFGSPFLIKKKLEKLGKEVLVLTFDELSEQKIEGLGLDAMINFLCPRVGTDDLDRYKIPMVNYTALVKNNFKL